MKAKASWEPPSLRSVETLVALATPIEVEANRRGIFNVFDDGGYRTLLLLEMLGLRKANPGRMGDDASDEEGRTFELKTVNLINTKGEERRSYPGVTTEHTLRIENLRRYRQTSAWVIGVFKGNLPLDVYVLAARELEPFFKKWEGAIAKAGNHEINNPKIPFGFVASRGRHLIVPGTEGIPRPRIGRFEMPDLRDMKRAKSKLRR